jgi:hypothetical protein
MPDTGLKQTERRIKKRKTELFTRPSGERDRVRGGLAFLIISL